MTASGKENDEMHLPWSKYYWGDWLRDINLRACSYAARGLWKELLCLMYASDRRGYLLIAGKAPDDSLIARITAGSAPEVTMLRGELLANGVPSVDSDGIWYNRRMVRDEELRDRFSAAGRKGGGNPALSNSESEEGRDQKPDTRGSLKGGIKGGIKVSSNDAVTDAALQGVTSKDARKAAKAAVGQMAELIYAAYPKKVAKKDALKAIEKALSEVDGEWLLLMTRQYADARKGQDDQYTPYPATWFNRGHYNDNPAAWLAKSNNRHQGPPSPASTACELDPSRCRHCGGQVVGGECQKCGAREGNNGQR